MTATYKKDFLQTCISASAIRFGTFTLKSGRVSPYFFNAGLFHRADLLRSISSAYAQAIASFSESKDFHFDVLFGPAYKGIPLATAALAKLADLDPVKYGHCSYSFNRKEAKDHGEGGNIVGSPLKGKKVIIIDDVITAGTAIREAIEIIQKEGGQLVGIIVALDRMERTPTANQSAIGEIQQQYGIPVLSVLTLNDLIEILNQSGSKEEVQELKDYRKKYGVE
jgi:orotate phosphoribosyltransferase